MIYLLMETVPNFHDSYYSENLVVKAFTDETAANKEAERLNLQDYENKNGIDHAKGYHVGYSVMKVELVG